MATKNSSKGIELTTDQAEALKEAQEAAARKSRRESVFAPLAAQLRKLSADVLKAAGAHDADDELFADALSAVGELRKLSGAASESAAE